MNHRYLSIFKIPIANRYFIKQGFNKFFLGTLSCLLLMNANAYSEEDSRPLSLSEAIHLTLEHHPQLSTFAHRIEATQGLIDQAGVGQRANIHLALEDFAGTGEISGFDSAQTTLSIDWILQNDLIESRLNAATVAANEPLIEQQIAALDLSAQTSRLYIQGLIEQRRLVLAESAAQQAEDTLRAIAKRVRLGKSPEFERLQAEVTLAQRELTVEDLHHSMTTIRHRLAAQWGNRNDQYQLNGNLYKTPQLGSVDIKFEQLLKNPALDLLITKQRIAGSKIELARIEAKPRWQISAGVRRLETTEDFGFVAGLSVPLGQDKSSSGKIRSLYAQQEEYAAEYEALHQELRTQLYVLLQEIKHSSHVIETLENKIIPNLSKAQNQALQAYETGKLSYTQWADIQDKKLVFEQELLTAYEAIHLQHIELQRLTGTSLSF